MASIKKFINGLYQYATYFKISDPVDQLTDPEVKNITPYRGLIQQQGDMIEADDINNIQKNGVIFSEPLYKDNLGTGIEGYDMSDFTIEQDMFNGLKVRLLIPETNLYENPKIIVNSQIYDTQKSEKESFTTVKKGDLVKNKIYDFVYLNSKFTLQSENRAGENTYGTITEARIKEITNTIINETITAYTPIPVGGLYISTNPTNPSTIWKNTTWEQYAPGRVLVGINASDDNFKTLGQTGGTKTEILNLTQIPGHNHSCDSQGNHAHYVNPNGNHSHIVDNHAHYVPPHQHVSGWVQNAGSFVYDRMPWGCHDLGQPIYAGPAVGFDYNNQISPWTSPTDMWTHGSQPGTSVAGWHDHSTNTTGAHAHNIGNSGGGQSHNNLQPYIVVVIWRRLT